MPDSVKDQRLSQLWTMYANQLEDMVDEWGYGPVDNPSMRNRAHALRRDIQEWVAAGMPGRKYRD